MTIPPEALAALREPVVACPQCASLDIRAAEMGDGIIAGGGELAFRVCRRCGYRGQPVEFRKREDYAKFAAEVG